MRTLRLTGVTGMTGVTGIAGMTGKTRITGMTRRTELTGITGVTVMTRVSGMTGINRIDRMTTVWHKILQVLIFVFFAIFPAICKNKLTWMTGMTCLVRMNRMTIN